ncbi:MAG: T9SS type A sorting domain-containing protein [Balneolaceae bacterium]
MVGIYLSEDDPIANPAVDIHIAKKLGIIQIDFFHGESFRLIGAIIEGVEYGDFAVSTEYEEQVDKKNSFYLSEPYTNPFNPTTNINFTIPQKGMVSLVVYDVLGREVATLVNGTLPAGKQSIRFDASNLANGMYLYKLRVNNQKIVRKMTLIK